MSFIAELKRRNVIRVVVFYVVTAWLLLEVAELLFQILLVPDWGTRLLFGLLALGFPLVVFLAWAYEMTPEGLRREAELEQDRPQNAATARKLDIAVIVVVLLGVLVVVFDRRGPSPDVEGSAASALQTEASVEEVAGDESQPIGTTASERSIAVLPFVNLSDDPENEYFADGLSEELLNVLAQLPDLLVAGRTSSFAFKGENQDLTEVGTTLGVAHILEGSVRRQNNQVRVTAQLIRSSDGFHLWSQTYDRTLDDVFAIQDDIANNVAEALAIVLDDDTRRRMERAGVRNVEAFMAYQKALALFDEAHAGDALLEKLAEANQYFEQAIALVPDFAAAWTYWGDYYAHLLMRDDTPQAEREQALREQRRSFDRAYEAARDPGHKAFLDVARVLFSDDWSILTDRLERALAEGGCPRTAWTSLLVPMGYGQELSELYRRQVACDPLASSQRWNLIGSLLSIGRLDEAESELEAARKTVGNNPGLTHMKMILLILRGQYEEARVLGDTVPIDNTFVGPVSRIFPLAAEGRVEEARARLDRYSRDEEREDLHLLAVLGPLGDRDAANRTAAELDARSAGPFILLNAVQHCACGAPFDLEATPRFAARLKESGLPWPPSVIIDFSAKDW